MAEKYYYNEDRKIVLSVNSSGTEAHLLIEEGLPFYNEVEILRLLEQAGIVDGFEEASESLKRRGITKDIGKQFLIAKGIPMLYPRANYTFLVKEKILDEKLFQTDKFSIDDLEDKTLVTKDTPIATFHAADSGREGCDIFGQIIRLPRSKLELCHLYAGSNVRYDEKTGQYIAEADGYIYINRDNKLCILNQIEIRGDVVLKKPLPKERKKGFLLYEKSDYDIFGNLIIHGDLIGPGMINLKGNLHVKGNINNCHLYVEGETECKGQISESDIVSLDSVEIKSSINSRISCGNNITIREFSQFSLLIAEGNVLMEKEKSSSWNTSIYAGKMIKLYDCDHALPDGHSKLVISIAPFTKELIVNLKKKIDRLRRNPMADKNTLQKMQTELDELKDYLIKRYTAIDYKESKILVTNRIVKGTYIRILKYYRVLESSIWEAEIFLDNDRMITRKKMYY